jgi:hypothetical protein
MTKHVRNRTPVSIARSEGKRKEKVIRLLYLGFQCVAINIEG